MKHQVISHKNKPVTKKDRLVIFLQQSNNRVLKNFQIIDHLLSTVQREMSHQEKDNSRKKRKEMPYWPTK